jgi:molybdopterin converting factor subunit 1
MTSGTVTVHLFASAAERVGAPVAMVPFAPTVTDLRRVLTDNWPSLIGLIDRCAIAVNHEYASDDMRLTPGDEIAVIPPVSGG